MPRHPTILLIRHLQAAKRTKARLNARTGNMVTIHANIVPFSEIRNLGHSLPDGNHDALIMTSPLTAPFVFRDKSFDKIKDLPVYCVGKTTAQNAVDAGFSKIERVTMDALSLAKNLIADNNTRNILYPCAINRSFDFAKHLKAQKITVSLWPVYENSLITPSLQKLTPAIADTNTVFLYSRRTASHFFKVIDEKSIGEAIKQHHFVAISQNVASEVPRKFQSNTYIANEKNEPSMIVCLENLHS